jgi:hypothetical protein
MYTEVCIDRTGSETEVVGKPMTGVSSPAYASHTKGRWDVLSSIKSVAALSRAIMTRKESA